MRDFTPTTYHHLLMAFKRAGYSFQPLNSFMRQPLNRVVVLRHDVDLKCRLSLQTARMEAESGILGTYYFRVTKGSNCPKIIKSIVAIGHEIGYHYEDLSVCNGNISQAVELFQENLSYFRRFYQVETICMHGSPLSSYDSRDLWLQADYRDYGLIAEPYFDIDFSRVFYLTDTGRRWNGELVSIRDKVPMPEKYRELRNQLFSTIDVIRAVSCGLLPDQVMVTVHPQRWDNRLAPWAYEWLMQRVKNTVKGLMVKKSARSS